MEENESGEKSKHKHRQNYSRRIPAEASFLNSIQFNPNHAVPLLIMNVCPDPKKVFSQLHGRLIDSETVTGRCMDFEKGEVG